MVAIRRDIQRHIRVVALAAPGIHMLLHLSLPLSSSLSVWQLKRKPEGIPIPTDRPQREEGSFPHMSVGSRTDFDFWVPDAGRRAQQCQEPSKERGALRWQGREEEKEEEKEEEESHPKMEWQVSRTCNVASTVAVRTCGHQSPRCVQLATPGEQSKSLCNLTC